MESISNSFLSILWFYPFCDFGQWQYSATCSYLLDINNFLLYYCIPCERPKSSHNRYLINWGRLVNWKWVVCMTQASKSCKIIRNLLSVTRSISRPSLMTKGLHCFSNIVSSRVGTPPFLRESHLSGYPPLSEAN